MPFVLTAHETRWTDETDGLSPHAQPVRDPPPTVSDTAGPVALLLGNCDPRVTDAGDGTLLGAAGTVPSD